MADLFRIYQRQQIISLSPLDIRNSFPIEFWNHYYFESQLQSPVCIPACFTVDSTDRDLWCEELSCPLLDLIFSHSVQTLDDWLRRCCHCRPQDHTLAPQWSPLMIHFNNFYKWKQHTYTLPYNTELFSILFWFSLTTKAAYRLK